MHSNTDLTMVTCILQPGFVTNFQLNLACNKGAKTLF